MLIDTHCHLTHPRFADDLPAIMAQAQAAGVVRMVTIGTGTDDAKAGVAIAERFPDQVSCAVALDPFHCLEAGDRLEADFTDLETLLSSSRFVAVGEFGLEYHHRDTVPDHAAQRVYCERQLDLAVRMKLPALLHVRDAHEDMLAILENHPQSRGLIHSFSEGPEIARRFLDRGWYLSFNGMITYKANDALRAAAKLTPNDRLLIETDAPYLAPVPHRGQRCTPGLIANTANYLAELRGERPEDLAAWTTLNAVKLLALPSPWKA